MSMLKVPRPLPLFPTANAFATMHPWLHHYPWNSIVLKLSLSPGHSNSTNKDNVEAKINDKLEVT
jgi:hypothetical protein